MSRRSPIATLLRVAELREAAARGEAARSLSAVAAAGRARASAEAALAQAGLAGGSREALGSTTQVRLWRAEGVERASEDVQGAEASRDQALHAWTESRRRQRLLETLAVRKREEARAHREKNEQALADELSGFRNRRS